VLECRCKQHAHCVHSTIQACCIAAQRTHAGRPLTEDQKHFEYVLDSPNQWLLLLKYMTDPDLIVPYMAAACSAQVLAPSALLQCTDCAEPSWFCHKQHKMHCIM
jgi:hypothetical protein